MSLPFYFPPVKTTQSAMLVDGGVWTTNPTARTLFGNVLGQDDVECRVTLRSPSLARMIPREASANELAKCSFEAAMAAYDLSASVVRALTQSGGGEAANGAEGRQGRARAGGGGAAKPCTVVELVLDTGHVSCVDFSISPGDTNSLISLGLAQAQARL